MQAPAPITDPPATMHSCIYRGTVDHTRLKPHRHQFQYSAFMMYLDLAELDTVFAGRWLWSSRHFTLAWFRRRDHLGDPHQPLDHCVRSLVEQQTGHRPLGPIRLLTNLRYYGYVMNPVSYYYCYDSAGERLEAIVVEIHNTPWGERHCYVVTPSTPAGNADALIRYEHAKDFHVSPFMPMDLRYHWQFNSPSEVLSVGISLSRNQEHIFHANLNLVRVPITGTTLATTLLRYPWMTAKVVCGIYWQAFKLWWKKTPFYPHPNTA
jgi:DUF1365 family protein